jgi:hypothetical protein
MLSTSDLPPELLALKDQFHSWRLSRPHSRCPIPDHLILAAKALLHIYPASVISKACRLHPKFLKPSPSSSSSLPASSPNHFLHLPSVGSAPAVPTTSYRLLIDRPDGCRLSLHLPSLDLASIQSLISSFLLS